MISGAGSSRHMIGLLLLFCISWAITTAGTYLHECSSAPDPFLCFCPSYELSLNLAKYACPSSYNTSAQYIYFSYSEDGTLTGAAELQAALYIFREATRSILPEMRLEVRDHTFHPGEGYTRRRTQEETELEGEALQVEQYPWASRAAQLNLARETIEMSVSGPPTVTFTHKHDSTALSAENLVLSSFDSPTVAFIESSIFTSAEDFPLLAVIGEATVQTKLRLFSEFVRHYLSLKRFAVILLDNGVEAASLISYINSLEHHTTETGEIHHFDFKNFMLHTQSSVCHIATDEKCVFQLNYDLVVEAILEEDFKWVLVLDMGFPQVSARVMAEFIHQGADFKSMAFAWPESRRYPESIRRNVDTLAKQLGGDVRLALEQPPPEEWGIPPEYGLVLRDFRDALHGTFFVSSGILLHDSIYKTKSDLIEQSWLHANVSEYSYAGQPVELMDTALGLAHLQACSLGYLRKMGLGCYFAGPSRDGFLIHEALLKSTMHGPAGMLRFNEGNNFPWAHFDIFNVRFTDWEFEESTSRSSQWSLEYSNVYHADVDGKFEAITNRTIVFSNHRAFYTSQHQGFIQPDAPPLPKERMSHEVLVAITIGVATGVGLIVLFLYRTVTRSKSMLLDRSFIHISSVEPLLVGSSRRVFLLRGTYATQRITFQLMDCSLHWHWRKFRTAPATESAPEDDIPKRVIKLLNRVGVSYSLGAYHGSGDSSTGVSENISSSSMNTSLATQQNTKFNRLPTVLVRRTPGEGAATVTKTGESIDVTHRGPGQGNRGIDITPSECGSLHPGRPQTPKDLKKIPSPSKFRQTSNKTGTEGSRLGKAVSFQDPEAQSQKTDFSKVHSSLKNNRHTSFDSSTEASIAPINTKASPGNRVDGHAPLSPITGSPRAQLGASPRSPADLIQGSPQKALADAHAVKPEAQKSFALPSSAGLVSPSLYTTSITDEGGACSRRENAVLRMVKISFAIFTFGLKWAVHVGVLGFGVLTKEIELLMTVKHPRILGSLGGLWSPDGSVVLIARDAPLTGGTLEELMLSPIPMDLYERATIVLDVLNAACYSFMDKNQSGKLIHRTLQLSNIFMDEEFCPHLGLTLGHWLNGGPDHAMRAHALRPPETWRASGLAASRSMVQREGKSKPSDKSGKIQKSHAQAQPITAAEAYDVYQFGLVAKLILNRRAERGYVSGQEVAAMPYAREVLATIPADVFAVLNQCLSDVPSERPTFLQIQRKLAPITRSLVTLSQQVDSGLATTRMSRKARVSLEKEGHGLTPTKSSMAMTVTESEPIKVQEVDPLRKYFPAKIYRELRKGVKPEPVLYSNVSVFFADIVSYTTICSKISAQAVTDMLERLFSQIDEACKRHNLVKIETIGDAYMCAGNLPLEDDDPLDDPASIERMALFALEVVKIASRTPVDTQNPAKGFLSMRAGFHIGEAVGTVTGGLTPHFTVLGDCVNFASRMESTGVPNHVQISLAAAEALVNQSESWLEQLEYRASIEVKGKGMQDTFFLLQEEDARCYIINHQTRASARASSRPSSNVDASQNRPSAGGPAAGPSYGHFRSSLQTATSLAPNAVPRKSNSVFINASAPSVTTDAILEGSDATEADVSPSMPNAGIPSPQNDTLPNQLASSPMPFLLANTSIPKSAPISPQTDVLGSVPSLPTKPSPSPPRPPHLPPLSSLPPIGDRGLEPARSLQFSPGSKTTLPDENIHKFDGYHGVTTREPDPESTPLRAPHGYRHSSENLAAAGAGNGSTNTKSSYVHGVNAPSFHDGDDEDDTAGGPGPGPHAQDLRARAARLLG